MDLCLFIPLPYILDLGRFFLRRPADLDPCLVLQLEHKAAAVTVPILDQADARYNTHRFDGFGHDRVLEVYLLIAEERELRELERALRRMRSVEQIDVVSLRAPHPSVLLAVTQTNLDPDVVLAVINK